MKRQILVRILAISLLAASSSLVLAEKVTFEQLPRAVQKAVRVQAGGAAIEDIDRETKDGQTFYEVAFKRQGEHVELRVAQDGSVLSGGLPVAPATPAATAQADKSLEAPLSGARKVTMNEVPQPVQNAIRLQARGATIEDIDFGSLHGKPVYEAAFKRDGQHVELRVAEDGTVISPEVEQTAVQAQSLPRNVRRAIQAHVHPGKVTDIMTERRDGKTVYDIEYERDGEIREIVIAQDGTLVRGAGAVGAASSTAEVRTGSAGRGKVTMAEVPRAVRDAIRLQAGSAQIEDIDREVRDGKVVYQAAFKKDGRHTEIIVGEDGTLVGPLLSDTHPTRRLSANTQKWLKALPVPAQQTIQAQIGDGEIRDIDRERRRDRTVYAVEFMRQGIRQRIIVGEDGSLIQAAKP